MSSTRARVINVFPKVYGAVRATGLLDLPVCKNVFVRSYFLYKGVVEDPFQSLLRTRPQLLEGGNVLDVGANIGYTACLFSRFLNPGMKVYAFEPDPANFEMLQTTARRRAAPNLVVPVQAAVGEADGSVELWENRSHHADHRVVTDAFRSRLGSQSVTRRVPLVALDSWWNTRHPGAPIAFIKIDVQGYELNVCRGMSNLLEDNPEASVAFEYMPAIFAEMGYDSRTVLDFFTSRGMKLYLIEKSGTLTSADGTLLETVIKEREYVDLLATRRSL